MGMGELASNTKSVRHCQTLFFGLLLLFGLSACSQSDDPPPVQQQEKNNNSATPDFTTQPGQTITLASAKAENESLSPGTLVELQFEWTFISKPEGSVAELSDIHSVNPSFTADLGGEYVLQLTIRNNDTELLNDTVTVMVRTSDGSGDSETTPSDPPPTDSLPVDPVPTEPAPTDPVPVDPVPADPVIPEIPAGHLTTTDNCTACHDPDNWTIITFDHAQVAGACYTCHDGSAASGKSAGHIASSAICEACHLASAGINWLVSASAVDHTQVMGLCAGCHAQPAGHLTATNACDQCHDASAFPHWIPGRVNHDVVLGACVDCHLVTSTHISVTRSCAACHTTSSDPLSWSVAANAVDHTQVIGVCSDCHTSPAGHPAYTSECDVCHVTSGWKQFSRERVLDVTSATTDTITIDSYFSAYRYGDTLRIYHFKETNAVLKIVFPNSDNVFEMTATLNLFAISETPENIAKWINNQYSDALYSDAPEPEASITLDAAQLTINAGTYIDSETGPSGDTYDNYTVRFGIDTLFQPGSFLLSGFEGALTVHVRTGDIVSTDRLLDVNSASTELTTVSSYFTPYSYGSTVRFYHFTEQNAVLMLTFPNDDTSFEMIGTLYLFSDSATAESIRLWINNQTSDGLYSGVAEPVSDISMATNQYTILSTDYIGSTTAYGWDGTGPGYNFDNYSVDFQLETMSQPGSFQLPGFAGNVTVHVSIGPLVPTIDPELIAACRPVEPLVFIALPFKQGTVVVTFVEGTTAEQVTALSGYLALNWRGEFISGTTRAVINVPLGTEFDWASRFMSLCVVDSVSLNFDYL